MPGWFARNGGNRQPEGQVCAPLWGGRGSLLSRDPALCRGHCPHLPVCSPSCPEPRPRAKAGCPSTGPGLPRFSVSDPQMGPQERPALKTGTGGDRGILSHGCPSPSNRQASGKATPSAGPTENPRWPHKLRRHVPPTGGPAPDLTADYQDPPCPASSTAPRRRRRPSVHRLAGPVVTAGCVDVRLEAGVPAWRPHRERLPLMPWARPVEQDTGPPRGVAELLTAGAKTLVC